MSGSVLTLMQMLFSAACGLIAFTTKLSPFDNFKDADQFFNTAILAAIYSLGFYLFNSCFSVMHVSMVMVLRAAEPLTTLILSLALNGVASSATALPAPGRLAALFFTVFGCALSAYGEHGPSSSGLLLALAANICFSLRGILGKVFLSDGMRPVSLFFHLAWIGSIIQAVTLVSTQLFRGSTPGSFVCAASVTDIPVLLLNGVTFFAYIQLSWVCLGRMSAVSHSVANSLRRPATIAAALMVAPAPMSILNYSGMVLACVGALLYGLL